MNNIHLLDTNVLLDVPEVFEKYDNIHIISDIFREIDNLELKSSGELKYNIGRAKRQLKNHIDEISFIDDAICHNYIKNLPNGYSSTYVDNILLSVAIGLKKDGKDLTVLTNDVLLQLKLNCFDIKYESVCHNTNTYNGVYRFEYSSTNSSEHEESILNSIYSNKENLLELKNGQYLEIYDTDNDKVKDMLVYENGVFKQVFCHDIHNETVTVSPKNSRQAMAVNLLQNSDKKIKLIVGKAGTGKDILMLSQAFNEVDYNDMQIVWLKPNKGIKEVGSIGALPGDKYDKMRDNYIQIADYLGDEYVLERYLDEGKILIENMEFLRGRQFNHSIIYCTESQNLTEEMIKLIISRVGEGSYVYFNGDFDQSDTLNGGLYCLNKLAGHKLFGKVELTDVERSEVAKVIELL